MSPDAIATLSHFLPAAQVARFEPLAPGGWSGARLWRVETVAGRALCLRRWPPGHPSPDRLRFIHAVLAHVRAAGIDFVPVPIAAAEEGTFVEQAGHLWELAPWLPGRAEPAAGPRRERLAAALHALARFHLAAAGFATSQGSGPAVVERLSLAQRLQAGVFALLEASVRRGLDAQLDPLALRILERTRDRLVPLAARLAPAAQAPMSLQPAIRDIHREHVLFTEDRVTGLIDFGALRIDTPLADVARLVGSLAADDAAARQSALDAYAALRPLSERDRRLIDLLDESNVVLSGLNWIRWLYAERRDMGDLGPIARRWDELLQRLGRHA